MVFGNVGAGKSTLLNCMLGRYSKYLEPLHYEFYKKNKEKLKFEAKSNGESVT
jgi:ABC-type bacteriocin/lantibiotic exporter with double-glycine peptidase domain